MALQVLSLLDLIKSDQTEEDIAKLLCSFVSLHKHDSSGADDVEFFLHKKAIEFEKMDLARTYLVMSTFKSKPFIAGYFAISNKPLIIPKKQFNGISKTLQRRLLGIGNRTEQSSYEIKGFLLGQLGKSFSTEAQQAKACSGNDLLTLAYEKIKEAHRIIGGRVLYLECEPNDKVISFYKSNGFTQLENYESQNKYCLMVKQMRHIV